MGEILSQRRLRKHRVLEVGRVSKIQRLINAHRQDMRVGHNVVPIDISIVLRAWHLTDHRKVGSAGVVKMQTHRRPNAGQHTQLYTGQQGHSNRDHDGPEVGGAVAAGEGDGLKIDQADHSDNNRGRQNSLGQKIEHWGEKYRCQRNAECGQH